MYKLATILLIMPMPLCAAPKEDFLSILKKDQKIIFAEKNGLYDITIIKELEEDLIFTITEVGKDYIVVDNTIKEIRIPVYRIKSITTIKIPKEK